MPNCSKLNHRKFEIFSNLMAGKGSLLQFCKASYVFGQYNAKNDINVPALIIKPFYNYFCYERRLTCAY